MTKLDCNSPNHQCGGACLPPKKRCLIKASPKANEAANQLVSIIENSKEDAIVNTAGTVGGFVGSGVAGPIGSVAGDLIASTAAKHTLLLKDAYDEVKNDPEFGSLNRWQKANRVIELARSQERKEAATEEFEGFVIGNLAAEGLNRLPGIGGLPMKGALAAMTIVPKINSVRARRKLATA